MIKFDSQSIRNRIIKKLQQDPDWSAITNDSVISALIQSNAEINAETARYAEYLFRESRWDTAQNRSSIVSMANMLGYKPKRKVSATGKIYLSADAQIQKIGTSYPTSYLEALKNGMVPTGLNGWLNGNNELIDSLTTLTCNNKNYIVTQATSLPTNKKIVSVDIMQGEIGYKFISKNVINSVATKSKIDKCLYIPVKIENCEDASEIHSIQFFKVFVVYGRNAVNGGNYELDSIQEYRVVDSLVFSDFRDYDVEVYNDMFSQDLFYLKFNDDYKNGPTLDLSSNSSIVGINIQYVKSLGSEGNIDELYQRFTANCYDSNGKQSSVLYGINYSPINGGKDEEDVSSIKINAVKQYGKNYTVATKESYEKVISNMTFKFNINGVQDITPTKVNVFGGYDANNKPVTYVTFTGQKMEDIAAAAGTNEDYSTINEALNYYTSRIKAPQDILKFVPPEYITYTVGMDCTISNAAEASPSEISAQITEYIDNLWGSGSDQLDFNRNFNSSDFISKISSRFNQVTVKNLEVEAFKKLDWSKAERKHSKESGSNYSCRIGFNFSPVFRGDVVNKGFKDYRIGAKYLARIDLMYRNPVALGNNCNLHKSIFLKENASRQKESIFYCSNSNNTWEITGDGRISGTEYTGLSNSERGYKFYQVDFQKRIFSDTEFSNFETSINLGDVATYTDQTIGAIGDYIFYFSGNYGDEESSAIGDGWLEFNFDFIYKILTAFSIYDVSIFNKLKETPIARIKCGVGPEVDEEFKKFMDFVSNYIDIYVSFRPNDTNLEIPQGSILTNSVSKPINTNILCIDSYDSDVTGTTTVINLTNDKKDRVISVDYEYEG